GPPNVGKSRLFNALVGQDQAIVSSQAGTTRDYLTALCDCDGLAIELVDTAGIEAALDAIASQAQAHRADQAGRADLLLDCRSADLVNVSPVADTLDRPRLCVWTKGDQAAPGPAGDGSAGMVLTSAATGAGLEDLRRAIARTIRSRDDEAN